MSEQCWIILILSGFVSVIWLAIEAIDPGGPLDDHPFVTILIKAPLVIGLSILGVAIFVLLAGGH